MSWQSEPNTPAGHVPEKPEKFTLSGTPNLLKKFLFPEEKKTDKTKKAAQEKAKKKALPENFADDLMEYELEIERDNVEIEVVNKLTELYLIAMEFHQNDAHKYKIFEKKFQGLLLRPNVQASMTRATEIDEAPDEQKIKLQKIQEIEAEAAKVNKEKDAFELIQMHENDIIRKENIIANDINKQKKSLKERLEQRKAKKNNRATSLPPYELENLSDSSPTKLPSQSQQTIIEESTEEKPIVHHPPVKGSRRESRFYKLPINEQDEDEERANTPPKHEVFKAPSNSGRRPSKAGDLLPGVHADRRNSRKESFNREIEGRSSRSDSSKDSRKSILMKPITEENADEKNNQSNNTSNGIISPPVFSPEHDIQAKLEGDKKSSLIVLHSSSEGQVPEPIRERSNSSDSSSDSDSDNEQSNQVVEKEPVTSEVKAVEEEPKVEKIEEKQEAEIAETVEKNEEVDVKSIPVQSEQTSELVEAKLEEQIPVESENQERQTEIKEEENKIEKVIENMVETQEIVSEIVDQTQENKEVEKSETIPVDEQSQLEKLDATISDKKEDDVQQQPQLIEEPVSTSEAVPDEKKEEIPVQLEEKVEEIQSQMQEAKDEEPVEIAQQEVKEPESEIKEPVQEQSESKSEVQDQIESVNTAIVSSNQDSLEEKAPILPEGEQSTQIQSEEINKNIDIPINENPIESKSNEEPISQNENPQITSESQPQSNNNTDTQENIEHPIEQHVSQPIPEFVETSQTAFQPTETQLEVKEEAPQANNIQNLPIQEEKKEEIISIQPPTQTESIPNEQNSDPAQEESKTEASNSQPNSQNPTTVEPEPEKKIIGRARRESEEIEAKKLEILRKIEFDQEKELKEFTAKQIDDKEKKLNAIENKYQEKAANNEGSQEQLENEKQEEIKVVTTNYLKEIEKFKKKLQMQKMFKMNQLVS